MSFVWLPMNCSAASETDLFHPSRETYEQLLVWARLSSAAIATACFDDQETFPPRFASAELAIWNGFS